jgi:dinuclear metal center YbgI/SA1388 family protein
MHVRDFIGEMERLAPPELAEDFDAGRIGLVVEGRPEIRVICCALDATPTVVKAAADLHADMLVVHHTPLWVPVTALTGRTASLMKEILSSGMNLYVMHTNFDRADEGVNDALAELLSLTERRPMLLGLIGACPISPQEISRRLGGNIRVWGTPGPIRQLAIVAGSGFDTAVMAEAHAQGADAFLSAELKHSVARSSPLPCIEATHYALEATAMKRLAAREGWHYLDDPPVLSTLP